MKGEISDEKRSYLTFESLSFVLFGLIVIGQTGFTQGSDYDQRMDNMMNECTNFMQSFDDNNENK
jgi:hypothetical protein